MKGIYPYKPLLLLAALILFVGGGAQEKPGASAQELADKLSNPVANLISVPFQSNVDYGIGTYHGSKYTLNFQPVIPIHLNPKLNLITRYIIPIVDHQDITGEGEKQFGLSDATISAFFAPADAKNGLTWGIGPAFLIPIGTSDWLSSRKWGLGPTALLLMQMQGLTLVFLVNQIWSFAGEEKRSEIDQLYLQPFFSKSWKSGANVGLNAEMTFNWEANTTIAFLNPTVGGITHLGTQTVSLTVGPRITLAGPEDGKAAFGFRGVLTFVFPE